MTRLENVIVDIQKIDLQNHAWIFENGKIRDDVICGDVTPLLEELKEYEVEFNDAEHEERAINLILEHATNTWNTYNWNANISHNIDVAELKIYEYTYMAIMVHRYGDIRANYTDRFVVKFDSEYEFYELESIIQPKEINDRYIADISLMTEGYNVYDYINGEDIGEFYELEKADLLNTINERA